MILKLPSSTGQGVYTLDTKKKTCTCNGFKFSHLPKTCRHLKEMNLAPDPVESQPASVSELQKQQIEFFDKWTRTRLSQNFIIRDFLFSSRADVLGIPNRPSDNPELVIEAGKALCAKVCEPLLAKFGRFAITYGYQSRPLIEAGYPKAKTHSSAPHQWDRGTFGKRVYARIDVLVYGVEDGQHSKYDVGRWMMANLDIDLLMMWWHSNVMCVTISPEPRRVFLEWFPQGQGDDGTNKRTYMGEHYWQSVWPTLPESKRPAFGPSCTGGRMYKQKD